MKTTNNFKALALFVLIAASFSACKKDRSVPEVIDEETGKEFKFVRVLVSDETASTLTQIDPFAAKINTFNTKYPMPSIYGTASGKYATVLYGAQNLVEVFDSGLLLHDDHVDVDGVAKWALITANGIKPTHFKSKGRENLIFNDGDGTLSVGNEADFNVANAKFKIINAGLLAHHGAMAQFSNGNYAITATTAVGKSPTSVIITDKNGTTVHSAKQEVGTIHGNASDGQNAVFGAFSSAAATSGGVLVVAADGTQKFISNPDGFGAFRLGTILYAEKAKKFIGYAANKGAYLVDVANNKITPIYTGTDAFQCKVDYAGNNLLILTLDGKLKIYDLLTGAVKKEGAIIAAVNAADTYKPVLEATAKYAYVAMPSLGEVHQINLSDFSKVIKHKVSAKPVRLTLLGFETSAGHND
ncbi:hypothetical protein FA048_11085 [Pedobacter polaris]|uniref:DUF4374 domain-containing protein n=1 Tax=Pedobacter polaris TaxID=2571273 RepID=A0A4U1CX95_9SPHI|nr:hypothetical protein [Pedobacter polaris]TKC10708.1 hypothetical protein FA048_11085 [Pedobacter polaris]